MLYAAVKHLGALFLTSFVHPPIKFRLVAASHLGACVLSSKLTEPLPIFSPLNQFVSVHLFMQWDAQDQSAISFNHRTRSCTPFLGPPNSYTCLFGAYQGPRLSVSPNLTVAYMTQSIMPQHANTLGITFGGQVCEDKGNWERVVKSWSCAFNW